MRRIGLSLCVLVALGASAFAQSYPARPVTVIVPYPAGGPTDQVARQIGRASCRERVYSNV